MLTAYSNSQSNQHWRMQPLYIRYCSHADIPIISDLAYLIWPETYKNILSAEQMQYMLDLFYSHSALKNQMDTQKHTFLIAEIENHPAGFASFSMINEHGTYKLQKLYVLQSLHGKGIGKSVLDFIVKEIRSQNGTALQLNVNRNNKARSFYEREGFCVIKEEDIDIGNDYFMNDYLMEKKI